MTNCYNERDLDIIPDLTLSFVENYVKSCKSSSGQKSVNKGFKYFSEGYIHGYVKLFIYKLTYTHAHVNIFFIKHLLDTTQLHSYIKHAFHSKAKLSMIYVSVFIFNSNTHILNIQLVTKSW